MYIGIHTQSRSRSAFHESTSLSMEITDSEYTVFGKQSGQVLPHAFRVWPFAHTCFVLRNANLSEGKARRIAMRYICSAATDLCLPPSHRNSRWTSVSTSGFFWARAAASSIASSMALAGIFIWESWQARKCVIMSAWPIENREAVMWTAIWIGRCRYWPIQKYVIQ